MNIPGVTKHSVILFLEQMKQQSVEFDELTKDLMAEKEQLCEQLKQIKFYSSAVVGFLVVIILALYFIF